MSLHGGSKVKVFDVAAHVLGVGGRERAIDDQFGGGGVSGGCAYIAWKVDEIAADRQACALLFCFVGSIIDTDAAVGDIFASIRGNGVVGNEVYRVSTLFSIADALSEASKFIGKRVFPCGAVFGAFNEVSIFHGGSRVWVDDGIGPVVGCCMWCFMGGEVCFVILCL